MLEKEHSGGLARKGFVLLLVPAVLQLILLVGFIAIYFESEFYPQRAILAKGLADGMTIFTLDYFALDRACERVYRAGRPLDFARLEYFVHMLKNDEARLLARWKEFPDKQFNAIIIKNPKEMDEMRKGFAARPIWLQQLMLAANASAASTSASERTFLAQPNRTVEMRGQIFGRSFGTWKESNKILRGLAEAEEDEGVSPEKRQETRNFVNFALLGGTGLTLLLMMFIGVAFTRNVLSKLTIMLDNSSRLAANQRLNPPIGGDDELASLDKEFHAMASSLIEANRSYRAMMDNANDLICSMDGQGRFIAVSQAAAPLLGYSSEELVGSWLMDIVDASEQDEVATAMREVFSGEKNVSLETRTHRKDGAYLDLAWSVSWSAHDRTAFCVAHDISEKKAAERLQREVLQMVSHDLRSPLSSIANFHELLEMGRLGNLSAAGAVLLQQANRNSQQMLRLINDLLEVERIRSGMLQLEKTPTQISELCQQALDSVRIGAENKNVQLVKQLIGQEIFADPHRLAQALTNLLNNAIDESPSGATVFLHCEKSPGFLTVSVRDQGAGMSAAEAEAIFDQFRGETQEPGRSTSKSGLGLAIAKSLVELHGAEIWVHSELGKGTAFFVRFSIAPDLVRSARGSTFNQQNAGERS